MRHSGSASVAARPWAARRAAVSSALVGLDRDDQRPPLGRQWQGSAQVRRKEPAANGRSVGTLAVGPSGMAPGTGNRHIDLFATSFQVRPRSGNSRICCVEAGTLGRTVGSPDLTRNPPELIKRASPLEILTSDNVRYRRTSYQGAAPGRTSSTSPVIKAASN